ncbi:MAG TPA: anti-sigma factor [Ktedonobacterales bacterium]|nr:anti-sigma factor [Ktedonobacterales bacterium]
MSDDTTLDCATAAPYLSAFADGELAEPMRSAVVAHTADCERCTAELDRISAIDRLIGSLPRTAPSAGVYERALAAATRNAAADPRAITRERLPGANGAALRRRIRDLIAPETVVDDEEAVAAGLLAPHPRRVHTRWLAAAVPAVAAVLLIALAASLFNRFPSFSQQGATSHPTPNTASALKQTRDSVNALAGQVAFTPVSPTYLPGGASAPRTTVGPAEQVEASSRYLDVTWTFPNGPVTSLHLRELPHGLGFDGYASPSAPSATPLSWSLPSRAGWEPLAATTCAACLAVGETRQTMQLALDAHPRAGATTDAVAAWLRLVSLSLDAPYQPLSVTLAAPDSSLVLRYLATVSDTQGHAWSWDVSVVGANGVQQSARAQGGGADVTEIINGGSGARLDNATHTYEPLTPPLPSAQPPRIVTQPLNATEEYIAAGELWNLGVGPVTLPDGRMLNAYDLYWVNAAQPEHLYADASSGQAVALVVTPSNVQPGGPNGVQTFISMTACQPYTVTYTFIEYVPQTAQTAALFNTQKPSGWRQGSVAPAFTCG